MPRPKFKTLTVSEDTYELLLLLKEKWEKQEGRTYSLNDVVRRILVELSQGASE